MNFLACGTRHDTKRKEDLMIVRRFPFLLRMTRLNGEIDGSKPDFI